MSRLIVACGAVFIVVAGASAQEAGRYAVQPSEDGFVRLDTETGAVSHCSRRDGKWYCDVLVENQTALAGEVAALSAEVKALRAEVAALKAELGALAGASPAIVAPLSAEDQKKFEEAMGFTELLMRRFFGLVRDLKREQAGAGG